MIGRSISVRTICGKYDIKAQAEKTFGGEVVVAEDFMAIEV
ncbi:MAG: hypothetical protein V1688_00280 [bacterium]